MSITGYSHSLRQRQQSSARSQQRLPVSEVVSCPIDQSSSDPPIKRSDQLPQSSVSIRPALSSPRHPSQILSDELRLNARANCSNRRETNGQDSHPSAQHRVNIKIPTRPNEVTRVNGAARTDDPLAVPKRPGLVVIHPRAFFRDCFVRCLEISYTSHNIMAFANICTWRASPLESAVNPSIVVYFVDGNDASSITDLQFLEATAIDTPVVIVSDIDDVNYVVRALKGGARGYIPTSLSFNVAVEAVRLVEAGGTFVPVSSLAMDGSKQEPTAKTGDLLTERQMMVVEALCQGMANKQIAYELGMSEHTVKVHLRHIMRKLRARNRTEVAVLTKDFFERPHEQKRLGADDGPH
ncbi:LuxR C-terminal-related transcriptional regulator [Afipia massiliensis]|uniref:LuxR C-terminal-related transcriptional regulator n=1 Tax=Afipia massiliensis TaxID=211460 RepID=UPI00062B2883|nr:response regulator transcription factor [Afipia massiliensis]